MHCYYQVNKQITFAITQIQLFRMLVIGVGMYIMYTRYCSLQCHSLYGRFLHGPLTKQVAAIMLPQQIYC